MLAGPHTGQLPVRRLVCDAAADGSAQPRHARDWLCVVFGKTSAGGKCDAGSMSVTDPIETPTGMRTRVRISLLCVAFETPNWIFRKSSTLVVACMERAVRGDVQPCSCRGKQNSCGTGRRVPLIRAARGMAARELQASDRATYLHCPAEVGLVGAPPKRVRHAVRPRPQARDVHAANFVAREVVVRGWEGGSHAQ